MAGASLGGLSMPAVAVGVIVAMTVALAVVMAVVMSMAVSGAVHVDGGGLRLAGIVRVSVRVMFVPLVMAVAMPVIMTRIVPMMVSTARAVNVHHGRVRACIVCVRVTVFVVVVVLTMTLPVTVGMGVPVPARVGPALGLEGCLLRGDDQVHAP